MPGVFLRLAVQWLKSVRNPLEIGGGKYKTEPVRNAMEVFFCLDVLLNLFHIPLVYTQILLFYF